MLLQRELELGEWIIGTFGVSIPQAVSAVATDKNSGTAEVKCPSFNTASGKCCCNAMTTQANLKRFFVCFNTASGKCCCNSMPATTTVPFTVVSIPQAVSAVATFISTFIVVSDVVNVSIPQAVSAVATKAAATKASAKVGFNTASGKCCCKKENKAITVYTIACFNTASGKCCCNWRLWN